MLIVNQVMGDYVAHHLIMGLYLNRGKVLLERFGRYYIQKIPKGENSHAKAVEKIALIVHYYFQCTIPFEYFTALSVKEAKPEIITTIDA